MSGGRIDINVGADDGLPDNYRDLLASIKRNLDPASNTVLLVDDERGIRMKVARDVKAFDPTIVIHEAVNGRDALDKLATIRQKYHREPLFIVLDLNMPVLDGWEVIKQLKKEYEEAGKTAGIPIIVLSSTSGEKSAFLKRTSIHDGKTGYVPLVSVAKETCMEKDRYDTAGEKGLMAWLGHFIRQAH
ncbi:MAG TPA: hypothetical protein DCS43_05355 [Verrucomicrobia bacterium]|nr:hypothetical protein [Verrucomicrobiota bacterium]